MARDGVPGLARGPHLGHATQARAHRDANGQLRLPAGTGTGAGAAAAATAAAVAACARTHETDGQSTGVGGKLHFGGARALPVATAAAVAAAVVAAATSSAAARRRRGHAMRVHPPGEDHQGAERLHHEPAARALGVRVAEGHERLGGGGGSDGRGCRRAPVAAMHAAAHEPHRTHHGGGSRAGESERRLQSARHRLEDRLPRLSIGGDLGGGVVEHGHGGGAAKVRAELLLLLLPDLARLRCTEADERRRSQHRLLLGIERGGGLGEGGKCARVEEDRRARKGRRELGDEPRGVGAPEAHLVA